MIVVVDSITQKKAIELGHIEVEIKILLECLFKLSSKSNAKRTVSKASPC